MIVLLRTTIVSSIKGFGFFEEHVYETSGTLKQFIDHSCM